MRETDNDHQMQLLVVKTTREQHSSSLDFVKAGRCKNNGENHKTRRRKLRLEITARVTRLAVPLSMSSAAIRLPSHITVPIDGAPLLGNAHRAEAALQSPADSRTAQLR